MKVLLFDRNAVVFINILANRCNAMSSCFLRVFVICDATKQLKQGSCQVMQGLELRSFVNEMGVRNFQVWWGSYKLRFFYFIVQYIRNGGNSHIGIKWVKKMMTLSDLERSEIIC